MELTDDSWSTVRNTPGVTGFVGATSRPTSLSLDDVVKFLLPPAVKKTAGRPQSGGSSEASPERSEILVDLEVVSIFGRETPVELTFTQVAKI